MRNTHHRFADFLLLMLLLFVLLAALLVSNIGAKSLAALLNAANIGLHIEGVNGSVVQGLHLERIVWRDKRNSISLTNIKLKLDKVPYHKKRFNIKKLTAERLDIRLLPQKGQVTQKTTYNIEIPSIPFPVDMYSEHVSLDSLHIYNRANREVFSITDMNVHEATILDSLLKAQKASAKPLITEYPMGVWLNDVLVDFKQPHAMQGQGKVKYSHILTGQFSGDAKVSGTWTNYKAETSFQWKERLLGKSQVKLQLEGDYDGLKLSNVELENKSGDFTGQVNLGWFENFTWDAEVFGKHVDLSTIPKVVSSDLETELKTQGGYDFKKKRWFFNNDFQSLEGEIAGFPVESSGKIRLKEGILSVDGLDARSGINRLKLDGQITEPFQFTWDVNARDMSQVLPSYSGLVVGKGELSGTTFATDAKGELSIRGLKAGEINVDYAELDFDGGLRDSKLSGFIDADLKRLVLKDLSVDKALVKMKGTGESLETFIGKGSLQLGNIKAPEFSSQQTDINFDINDQNLKLSGELKQVQLLDTQISTANLSGSGRIDNHTLSLRAKSALGNLQSSVKGGWFDDRWRGYIDSASLKNTATGEWKLQKPSHVDVTKTTFNSNEICIASPTRGDACSSLSWQKGRGGAGKGRIKLMPLNPLTPWLPDSLVLPGKLSGVFDVKQTAEGLFGNVELSLPDDRIGIKRSDGKLDHFNYQQGEIKLSLQGNKIHNRSEVVFEGRGRLQSEGVISLNKYGRAPSIDNNVTLTMKNLAWLQEFFPDITNLQGGLSSSLQLSGVLENPTVNLKATLKNGAFEIPDTGTKLSDINIQMHRQSRNKAKITGNLRAGTGVLNIEGVLNIKRLNDWVADLNLQGKDLLFMNTHEVQSYISPSLTIKATPLRVKVNGALHVPKTTIRLDELPEGAIYESEDVVIKGQQEKPKTKKTIKILPNVKITLGKPVTFSGFGLKSHLEGSFFVTQHKGTTLSRGTVRIVDGQYRAYGQSMEIEQGVLVFNGPIGNPGLDIRAIRSVSDIKVGLNLAGTLQRPQSSVFSDPPQAEEDALSYLLTGQSLSETTGDEAQLLVQAVRTLGINSGSSFLNRIGGSVGLDDVNIITYGDYRQNKLQLGKRLGSRLYIRYITGLFDTFHKIAVDYTISPKWSLEAESGEDQGIDFIYEIESD